MTLKAKNDLTFADVFFRLNFQFFLKLLTEMLEKSRGV